MHDPTISRKDDRRFASDIAQALGIDMATVKTHIAKIFEKLGVANRSEAVAVALRKQLVKI